MASLPMIPAYDLLDIAIHKIYAAAAAPDVWPQALQAIADCTGDVGTVMMWRRDDGRFGTIVSPRLEAAQRDYVEKWWQHDIRAQRGVEKGYQTLRDGVTDRDLVSDEEMATHPIYTEFLFPHGLGWIVGVNISPDPAIWAVITVQRSADRPHFSDAELQNVVALARHIEQSLRLSIRLMNSELMSQGLLRALSGMDIGVFALDDQGQVIVTNDAGQALIGNGLVIEDNIIRPQFGATVPDFSDVLDDVLRTTISVEPRPILLPSLEDGHPIVLHFIPTAPSLPLANEMLASARVLMLAIKFDRSRPVDAAIVRDILGLTLHEARIASLVGNGLAPREAAEKLGITEETARTVLKRVFSKTGVSRQSELVALLSRLTLRRPEA